MPDNYAILERTATRPGGATISAQDEGGDVLTQRVRVRGDGSQDADLETRDVLIEIRDLLVTQNSLLHALINKKAYGS